ncbi:MAG: family 1 glycosylhydrolase [Ginsengibacter sp.]
MTNLVENTTIPLWGGIECTINRIDDDFHDQLEMGNYYSDPAKLQAIIDLGIQTLRFPILWEKHQPQLDREIDWKWAEEQLEKLRGNRITPIIGLLHHGSGPIFTDLLDNNFPELFASYAAKVAAKFPWITFYNPINEPLTTARFSGLYGLWYPHKKNDVSFIKMLLNELKGIVLAMKEIRKVTPQAKLVQTEDLGKTYSTPLLSYQANFENMRRWLTYDLLCGRVDVHHPLWNYFMRLGIDAKQLEFFHSNTCKPDVIGVNYYLTSERYLDEHLINYPANTYGGNAIHSYADVEAVRVVMQEPYGLSVLLNEIWNRYRIRIGITEVHLQCTREEQVRWLKEVYDISLKSKQDGIDICGITSWALFGSYGWDRLLTDFPGNYETGAFDACNKKVRPTAVAKLITSLINDKPLFKEITNIPGWWKCDERYFSPKRNKNHVQKTGTVRPIIIIGKNGTLGQAFARICKQRKFHFLILNREQVDICDSKKLELMFTYYQPWAVINAAGFVDIDKAEECRDKCYRENYLGVQKLGILCERLKVKLLTFSSDQVFDGRTSKAYNESDLTNPLNIYGHSKQLAESFLKNINPSSIIVRTSAFFGPWDQYNFLTKMLVAVSSGARFATANDYTISPTYVPHLVHASLDLLLDDVEGIWHLANKGETTWYQWARTVANLAGYSEDLIMADSNEIGFAKKPAYSALGSQKYFHMPTLDVANLQYLKQLSASPIFRSIKIKTP